MRLGRATLEDAAELLEETLEEEKVEDEKLTELAESSINEEAGSRDDGNEKPRRGARKK